MPLLIATDHYNLYFSNLAGARSFKTETRGLMTEHAVGRGWPTEWPLLWFWSECYSRRIQYRAENQGSRQGTDGCSREGLRRCPAATRSGLRVL